jgi:tRNA-2-methylthio-N6-dimethylallyladenosine synthase
MARKTVYLKSFGCQMNDADSEQLLGILGRTGYAVTERPEGADLILLNTCAIRGKAEQKVFSDLGRLKALKEKNPLLRIGVAGCVAQSMGKKILSREPAVDFVVGTQSAADLPRLVLDAVEGKKGVSLKPEDELDLDKVRTDARRTSAVHAYVPVIHGCENFCAYCVVPYVRGSERSRSVDGIVKEVRELARRGYKEITLLGQNVNSYGKKTKENISFAKLLHMLHEIDGIERIRFVTSHPRDLAGDVIQAMATLPKVCEALHLPVQSGSDRILEAMNRGYTRSEYLRKVAQLREAIPGIALSTDIIVGFPGEGEADFEATTDLVREADFDHLFGFCFSPRPGTPAAGFSGRVDETLARARLERLFELHKQIRLRKHQALVGRVVDVLVEKVNPKDPEGFTGRTRTNKIVHLRGEGALVGKTVRVRIDEGLPNCLKGTVR